MEIHHVSRPRFVSTIVWAIGSCIVIISIIAGLARATLNMHAALTDQEKPDIALYLLLPDEEIGATTVLRETDTQRDYLAETKDGKKLIVIKWNEVEKDWYVESVEMLHE